MLSSYGPKQKFAKTKRRNENETKTFDFCPIRKVRKIKNQKNAMMIFSAEKFCAQSYS